MQELSNYLLVFCSIVAGFVAREFLAGWRGPPRGARGQPTQKGAMRVFRSVVIFGLIGCATHGALGHGEPVFGLAYSCKDSTATGMSADCSGFIDWLARHPVSRVLSHASRVVQAEGFALSHVDSSVTTGSLVTEPKFTWPAGIKEEKRAVADHPGTVVSVTVTASNGSARVLVSTKHIRSVRMVKGTNPQMMLTIYWLTQLRFGIDSSLARTRPN